MDLTSDIAREILLYDSKTGLMFWRERDAKYFAEEMHCRRWNTKFSGREAFTAINHHGYKRGAIFNKNYLAHRVVWLMHYDEWPRLQIDHIDGDRKNNRIENLRLATPSENMMNRKIDTRNSSGVTGVVRRSDGKAWCVSIARSYLGSFETLDEAEAVAKSAYAKLGYSPRHGMPS